MLNNPFDEVLTPIQQRWLAVGLLLLVILISGLVIIMPIVNKWLTLHQTKNNLVFKLQQYERILATKETVIEYANRVKQQSVRQNYFNMQETEALVSAQMQDLLKQIIIESQGQLVSTQIIANEENTSDKDSRFQHIAIRVSMKGNSEVLRAVLFKIETAVPLMMIDQLDIRPIRGRRNTKTGGTDPSNMLDINFQAFRFMKKPNE